MLRRQGPEADHSLLFPLNSDYLEVYLDNPSKHIFTNWCLGLRVTSPYIQRVVMRTPASYSGDLWFEF